MECFSVDVACTQEFLIKLQQHCLLQTETSSTIRANFPLLSQRAITEQLLSDYTTRTLTHITTAVLCIQKIQKNDCNNLKKLCLRLTIISLCIRQDSKCKVDRPEFRIAESDKYKWVSGTIQLVLFILFK